MYEQGVLPDARRPELTPLPRHAVPAAVREVPHFADGMVPEAPPRPGGLLVFGSLAFIVVSVVLLRALRRDTPFLLVGSVYFPAWFSAGVIGAALATVTVIAQRSVSVTRAAGTGLVFFNGAVIYAFLVWLFLFS